MDYYYYPPSYSCHQEFDQIGLFLKGTSDKFCYKSNQICGDFLGLLANCHYFWATFVQNWASFFHNLVINARSIFLGFNFESKSSFYFFYHF